MKQHCLASVAEQQISRREPKRFLKNGNLYLPENEADLKSLDKTIILRVIFSVLLAVAAVVLFILNREREVESPEELQKEFTLSSQAIDQEIDGILGKFGIERDWVQKKDVKGDDARFKRVERRVLIPPSVVPALVNREMNLLAHRFQGRAVATENLKENTVTIHILLHQSVIQTVILKIDQNIQTKGLREQARKV